MSALRDAFNRGAGVGEDAVLSSPGSSGLLVLFSSANMDVNVENIDRIYSEMEWPEDYSLTWDEVRNLAMRLGWLTDRTQVDSDDEDEAIELAAVHHTQQFPVTSFKQGVSTFDTYDLLVIPSDLDEMMHFNDYNGTSLRGVDRSFDAVLTRLTWESTRLVRVARPPIFQTGSCGPRVYRGVRPPEHVPGSCPLFKAFVLRGASSLRFAGSSRFGFNVAGDKGVTALAASLRGAASCVTRGIRPTVADVIQFAVMAMDASYPAIPRHLC